MEPSTIHMRPVFVVMALGCFVAFLGGPLAVAVIVTIFAPPNVSMYIAPGAVVFFVIMAWAMSSSVHWVELDNGVIRARKLLTRKIVVHRVADTRRARATSSAIVIGREAKPVRRTEALQSTGRRHRPC